MVSAGAKFLIWAHFPVSASHVTPASPGPSVMVKAWRKQWWLAPVRSSAHTHMSRMIWEMFLSNVIRTELEYVEMLKYGTWVDQLRLFWDSSLSLYFELFGEMLTRPGQRWCWPRTVTACVDCVDWPVNCSVKPTITVCEERGGCNYLSPVPSCILNRVYTECPGHKVLSAIPQHSQPLWDSDST